MVEDRWRCHDCDKLLANVMGTKTVHLPGQMNVHAGCMSMSVYSCVVQADIVRCIERDYIRPEAYTCLEYNNMRSYRDYLKYVNVITSPLKLSAFFFTRL